VIRKWKLIGAFVFAVAFLMSYSVPELRNSTITTLAMIGGLLITTVGFYRESKQNDASRRELSKIFYNGKIHTFNEKETMYEAIFVEGERIKDGGSTRDMIKRYGKRVSEQTDLKGKVVVPGFNDSHMHLLGLGQSLRSVDLYDVKSIEEMIERGKKRINNGNFSENDWLIGRGWNQEGFDVKMLPTSQDLDKISKDIPVAFFRVCNHLVVINTKAWDLIGAETTKQVEGGEITLDEKGEFTGILKENAINLVKEAMISPSVEEIADVLELAQKHLLSNGITSVQTDDFKQTGGRWEDIVKAYGKMHIEERLKVRISQQCAFDKVEDFQAFLDKGGHGVQIGKMYKTGSIKILGDGSLGARTALLEKPYADDPKNRGIGLQEQENMQKLIFMAHKEKVPVVIHAIGDEMLRRAVEAIEYSRNVNKIKKKERLRDGIIHCQITNETMIEALREHNLIAFIQPVFTISDWQIVRKRVGETRERESYNWKTMQDAGVRLALGTDAPVETINPMVNLYAAVTRMDLEGNPKDGWLPKQKLTIEDAIRAYSIGSAYASGEELEKGKLDKGYLADFVVLSEDPFLINPIKIKDIRVEMTVVGGRIEYKKQ